jgi:hypothetical protein
MKLYQPVTEHMQLDMRMNLKTKRVRRLRKDACTSTYACQASPAIQVACFAPSADALLC